MTAEPRWLSRSEMEAIQAGVIRLDGGLAGLRDDNTLESALARAQQKWAHAEPDLSDLAAAYGFGLAKNHAFLDGNKRVALMAVYTFLGLNGQRLAATEAEAVTVMLGIASGELDEAALAVWIRRSMTPRAAPAAR